VPKNKRRGTTLPGDELFGCLKRAERTQNILAFNHYEWVRRANNMLLKFPGEHMNREEAESIPASNPDREVTRVDLPISVKGYSPDPTALELNATSTRDSAATVKIRG
jgi:hypothetical protein